MEIIPIKKWGNSNGIRVSKNIMDFLGVQTEDKIKITLEEIDGKRRLIIESINAEPELTIEQLFADYNKERVHVELQDLGEPVGNEKW